MALSASDQAMLDQISNGLVGAGNIPWSELLGQVTLGTPAPGTPTLKALEDQGFIFGQPSVNEQQSAAFYIDPSTGQRQYTAPYLHQLGVDTGYVYDPQLSAAPGSLVKTMAQKQLDLQIAQQQY